MRRASLLLFSGLVFVLAVTACGGAEVTGHSGRMYRDPAGWTVDVPSGWHLVHFSGSNGGVAAAGAQISNVRLTGPRVIPGYPVQSALGRQPPRGVGLVIASDTETGLPGRSRGYILAPPLPAPDQHGWNVGSTLVASGNPSIETLWFRGDHETFIASVKVGTNATSADLRAIDRIIHSLHFGAHPN